MNSKVLQFFLFSATCDRKRKVYISRLFLTLIIRSGQKYGTKGSKAVDNFHLNADPAKF